MAQSSSLGPAGDRRNAASRVTPGIARAILAEEIPGCAVSLSSDIVPQIREYYRLSTTVINAYLEPILARYIGNLEQRLSQAGLTTRQKYIMQSNGGMATFAALETFEASRGAVNA